MLSLLTYAISSQDCDQTCNAGRNMKEDSSNRCVRHPTTRATALCFSVSASCRGLDCFSCVHFTRTPLLHVSKQKAKAKTKAKAKNQSNNQKINQTNQSNKQPINQTTNQTTNQSNNQSISQSIKQSIKQSNNQTVNQSNNQTNNKLS